MRQHLRAGLRRLLDLRGKVATCDGIRHTNSTVFLTRQDDPRFRLKETYERAFLGETWIVASHNGWPRERLRSNEQTGIKELLPVDHLGPTICQAVAFLLGLTRGFPVLPTLPRISNPNPRATSDASSLEGARYSSPSSQSAGTSLVVPRDEAAQALGAVRQESIGCTSH